MPGIKFGSLALNRHCKNIGGFKFGGLKLYGSTCSQGNIVRNLVDFNLVVERQTTKAPNFPAVQTIIIHTVPNLIECTLYDKKIMKNARFSLIGCQLLHI